MREARVALVTGGGRGIGAATGTALHAAGFRVVLADIDAEVADRVARSLDIRGETAVALRIDVTSSSSVDETMAEILTRFGRLDALVNNAGTINPEPSETISDDNWARLLAVHLDGTFRCSRAAFAALKESGAGTIVNLASIAAHVAMPGRLSYTAAKAAVEGMARCLAVEWAEYGIRVNAVAPGYTATTLVQRAVDAGMLDSGALVRAIPLKRMADPREIAAAIVFLSSPESSYITGQTIVVDGGLVVSTSWNL